MNLIAVLAMCLAFGVSAWMGCTSGASEDAGSSSTSGSAASSSSSTSGSAASASSSTSGSAASANSSTSGAAASASSSGGGNLLTFTAEAGYRLEATGRGARQPSARLDAAGVTYLHYETDTGRQMATATDGLTFVPSSAPPDYRYHARFQLMPDGRWRSFLPSMNQATIISNSTPDGLNPTQDSMTRYAGVADDHATFGIVEVFPDPLVSNKYLMLYLGDLFGKNNVRRAVSTNGGDSFTFDRGNVLGDDSCNSASCRYVDHTSIALDGGERRLFAMRGGLAIDSFLSDNAWDIFTLESGSRVTPETFTSVELTCYSLHDPTVVKLADGRHRMYVTCRVVDDGTDSGAIVSAITPE
jgi:hypothetical protein